MNTNKMRGLPAAEIDPNRNTDVADRRGPEMEGQTWPGE